MHCTPVLINEVLATISRLSLLLLYIQKLEYIVEKLYKGECVSFVLYIKLKIIFCYIINQNTLLTSSWCQNKLRKILL